VKSVRPALRVTEGRDVPALCALINSAYRGEASRRGWTTEADLLGGQRTDAKMLRKTLQSPDSAILALEEGKELVGCVYVRNQGDRAYIGLLSVKPERQAAGLGRRLLSAAEGWIQRSWGLRRVEMTVIQNRKDLLGWYVRRGYRDTGRMEPFPYGDERFGVPKVDDLAFVVLEKTLAR